MTREEALSQVAPNLSYFNDCKVPFAISECKSWINKIFDDLEAQLKTKDERIKELEEAMKLKTCEGCKSLYINQYDEWSNYCKELNIEISNSTTSTFYCNRYEPKDAQC